MWQLTQNVISDQEYQMVICIGHSTFYVLIQSESGPAVSHRWVLSLGMRSTEFGTVDK